MGYILGCFYYFIHGQQKMLKENDYFIFTLLNCLTVCPSSGNVADISNTECGLVELFDNDSERAYRTRMKSIKSVVSFHQILSYCVEVITIIGSEKICEGIDLHVSTSGTMVLIMSPWMQKSLRYLLCKRTEV